MGEVRNVVLGGGLAGLMAAMTVQQAGEDDWIVLERGDRAGGHASSVSRDGYVFDYGPHILFTADPEMEALIRDLLGDNLRSQERRALIYHEAHGPLHAVPVPGPPARASRPARPRLPRRARAGRRGARARRVRADELRGVDARHVRRRDLRPADDPVRPEDLDCRAEHDGLRLDRQARADPRRGADHPRRAHRRRRADRRDRAVLVPVARRDRGRCRRRSPSASRRSSCGRDVERIDLDAARRHLRGRGRVRVRRHGLHPAAQHAPRLVRRPPAADRATLCGRLQYQGIFNVNVGVEPAVRSPTRTGSTSTRTRFRSTGSRSPATSARTTSRRARAPSRSRSPSRAAGRSTPRRSSSRPSTALRRAKILIPDDDHRPRARRGDLACLRHLRPRASAQHVTIIRGWLEEQRVWTAGRFGEWGYLNMDHAMVSGRAAGEAVLRSRAA